MQLMMQAIEQNKIFFFGISKMSKIDVDSIFLYKKSNNNYTKNNLNLPTHYPLIIYAIENKKERIVSSLLKAGSNPFLHEIYDDSVQHKLLQQQEYKLFEFIKDIPHSNLVWILFLLYKLRKEFYEDKGIFLSSITENAIFCSICKVSRLVHSNNYFSFLRFQPCQHILCTDCFWTNIYKLTHITPIIKNNSCHYYSKTMNNFMNNASNDEIIVNNLKEFLKKDESYIYKFIEDKNSYCLYCLDPIVTHESNHHHHLHQQTIEKTNCCNNNNDHLLYLEPKKCNKKSLEKYNLLPETITELKNKISKQKSKINIIGKYNNNDNNNNNNNNNNELINDEDYNSKNNIVNKSNFLDSLQADLCLCVRENKREEQEVIGEC
jgi:hypothetical protein